MREPERGNDFPISMEMAMLISFLANLAPFGPPRAVVPGKETVLPRRAQTESVDEDV